jgi:hypothetical protein
MAPAIKHYSLHVSKRLVWSTIWYPEYMLVSTLVVVIVGQQWKNCKCDHLALTRPGLCHVNDVYLKSVRVLTEKE